MKCDAFDNAFALDEVMGVTLNHSPKVKIYNRVVAWVSLHADVTRCDYHSRSLVQTNPSEVQANKKIILDIHVEHVSIHSSLVSDLSFAAKPVVLFECQVAKTRLMPDFALEAVPKNHRTGA